MIEVIVVDHSNNLLLKLYEYSNSSIFSRTILGIVPNLEQVALDPGSKDSYFVTSKQSHIIVQLKVRGNFSQTVTIAGSGRPDFADGIGTSASFKWPECIVALDSNTLFVSDSGNSAIRKIVRLHEIWSVSTLAGTGKEAFADGFGTNAAFRIPKGMTIVPRTYAPDGTVVIFVADYGFLIKDFGNNVLQKPSHSTSGCNNR